VRPHPPPRRSGGPPGCPHPSRVVVFVKQSAFFGHAAYGAAYVVSCREMVEHRRLAARHRDRQVSEKLLNGVMRITASLVSEAA